MRGWLGDGWLYGVLAGTVSAYFGAYQESLGMSLLLVGLMMGCFGLVGWIHDVLEVQNE